MTDLRLARRAVLTAGLAVTLLPLYHGLAAYPERPITWIVAYAAGSGLPGPGSDSRGEQRRISDRLRTQVSSGQLR